MVLVIRITLKTMVSGIAISRPVGRRCSVAFAIVLPLRASLSPNRDGWYREERGNLTLWPHS